MLDGFLVQYHPHSLQRPIMINRTLRRAFTLSQSAARNTVFTHAAPKQSQLYFQKRQVTTDKEPPTESSSLYSQLHEQEKEIAELQARTKEFLMRGKLNSALEAAEACHEATVAYYGKFHPVNAAAINNVAIVYKNLGDLEKAKTHMEQAVEIYEKIVGESHPSMASALANLGLLHVTLSQKASGLERINYADIAKTLLEQALTIRMGVFNEKHAMVGVTKYQLASAYRLQKNYSKAKELLLESIQLLESTAGPKHTSTATARNNLGFLYKDQALNVLDEKLRGELLQLAQTEYQAALTIRHEALGEGHPDSLATANNLAECYEAIGDQDNAISLRTRILLAYGYTQEEVDKIIYGSLPNPASSTTP